MRACPELEAVSGSAGFSTASSQFLIAKTAVLMHPDNMLETFSEVAVKGPELMWPVLQASVAALVNVQSAEAVGAELKLRVVKGN